MALGRGLSSLIPDKTTTDIKMPKVSGGDDGLVMISISSIEPNPYQPRRNFVEKDLQDLANSIKVHGLLQPIVVTPRDDDGYYVVAGERRFRASQMLNLDEIAAIVRSADDQQRLELAIIENVQREDLNAIEKALAYKQLKDEFGMTQAQISRRVGMSAAVISSILSLLKLPEDLQASVANGEVSYKKARAIALSLGDEDEQTIRDMWERAKELDPDTLERETARANRKKKRRTTLDPVLEQKQKELEELFGTRVRVTWRRGKGGIVMDFSSEQELRDAIEKMLSAKK